MILLSRPKNEQGLGLINLFKEWRKSRMDFPWFFTTFFT